MSGAPASPPPRLRAARPARKIHRFHSLGYEQSDLRDFIRRLREHAVTLVVDVRDLPLSRKRGFSKRPLQAALREAGIGYLHLKILGAPKDLRDARRAGGSWKDYARQYAARVLRHRGEDIHRLVELAARERLSLLCFEREPERCHRSLVAAAMVRRGRHLRVEHLRY